MTVIIRKSRLYPLLILALIASFASMPASAQPNIQVCTNHIDGNDGLLTQDVTQTWSCGVVQAQTHFTVDVQLIWNCWPPGYMGCFPNAIPHPKFRIRARRVDLPGRTFVQAQANTINPSGCSLRPTTTSFTPWCNLPTNSYPDAVLLVGVYY